MKKIFIILALVSLFFIPSILAEDRFLFIDGSAGDGDKYGFYNNVAYTERMCQSFQTGSSIIRNITITLFIDQWVDPKGFCNMVLLNQTPINKSVSNWDVLQMSDGYKACNDTTNFTNTFLTNFSFQNITLNPYSNYSFCGNRTEYGGAAGFMTMKMSFSGTQGDTYPNGKMWSTTSGIYTEDYYFLLYGEMVTPITILNITAHSALNGGLISNFSIYRNGTFIGTTSTGFFNFTNISTGSYNITIDPSGYEIKSAVININGSSVMYDFSLYTENSLQIIIKDEDTGANITQNVTIRFTSSVDEFTNITNTSYFYKDGLEQTQYQLLFISASYSNRTYTVTIGNKTSQTLYAYLAASTSVTQFTLTDKDTNVVLPDTLATMYKYINGSWQIVESKNTDVTGKVQFNYVSLTNYKFNLSKTGYYDNVFYLNPVLFSTYDIKMTKVTTIDYAQDFERLSFSYYPTSFRNGTTNLFNFVINSPYGELTAYGVKLSYNGGVNLTTGTNPNGSTLLLSIVPNATTLFDTVKMDVFYVTTISGRRNFTMLYPITISYGDNVFGNDTNMTFTNNIDQTFGLGIFERILICTLIILITVGIATMIGQPIPGVALGLLILAYMVYVGFIPIIIILPSMLIGALLLAWKSGGY